MGRYKCNAHFVSRRTSVGFHVVTRKARSLSANGIVCFRSQNSFNAELYFTGSPRRLPRCHSQAIFLLKEQGYEATFAYAHYTTLPHSVKTKTSAAKAAVLTDFVSEVFGKYANVPPLLRPKRAFLHLTVPFFRQKYRSPLWGRTQKRE